MNKQIFRQAFLANAIADIGKGEEGGNNDGRYVRGLLAGVGVNEPAAWCAAAVWSWLYTTIEAMKDDELDLNVHDLRSPSARAMFNDAKELGWLVSDPEPGDIMIIKRTAYDAKGNLIDWLGHAAVVENKKGPGMFGFCLPVIEGNVGSFPAKVKRSNYAWPVENLLGFIRFFGDGDK